MKALLSVYDKTGIADLARALADAGCELVSTGGTASDISDAGLPVTQVADLTGSPEMLDGRVKTLHPVIHGGILARRDLDSHRAELEAHGIQPIDIVAGNLYPFVQAVSADGVTLQDALENIDIGGPTMIRSAAKNFPFVLVVVDPSDYGWIAERIADSGLDPDPFSMEERRELARKAFQHVALYDTAVSKYLTAGSGDTSWPELTFGYNRASDLRYGENPHQKATLYTSALSSGGIVRAERLHGIDMSYTNYLDADAAWRVVSDFPDPAVAIIKHTNPCGLAVHSEQPTAYKLAFEGDSVSAYGGIVGFNRPVTADTARAMRGVLFDIIVAPDYERRRAQDTPTAHPHPHPQGRSRERPRLRPRPPPRYRRSPHPDSRRHHRRPVRLAGRNRASAHLMTSSATSPSPGAPASTSNPTPSSWRRTTTSSAWEPDSPTV